MNNDLVAGIIIFGLVGAAIYLMKQRERKNIANPEEHSVNTSQKSKIVPVLKVLGVINIIVSVFLFTINTDLSAGVFISGLILYALGVLIYNSERQTEILEKLLDKENE